MYNLKKFSIADVVITSRPEGELYDSNGHTFLKLNKFGVDMDVGNMRIYATGLFPDAAMSRFFLKLFLNKCAICIPFHR